MSNWIAIAKADLYNSKASALVDTADTYNLGNGQTGRVAGIIADVTTEIRRKVGRCNLLDVDTTKIPGGLKNAAVDIIYCRLKVAIEQELTTAEIESLKARERELNRIADGKDTVDAPDNPEVSGTVMQSANPMQFSADQRKASSHKLSGLF